MNMSGMDMSGMNMSGMDMSSTSSSSAMHMSSMTMASSSAAATSTGMMSMSGMTMDMSSSATTTSSMNMDMSTMSGMSMNMASTSTSATASSTSTMDMSGMDMGSDDDSMSMTMWMTTKYKNTPVFFRTLDAHSSGAAFGIFCVLFFCSFFFRGLIFLSSYLEQAVFHNYSNTIIVEEDCDCSPDGEKQSPAPTTPASPPFGEVIRKLFWMGPRELMNDVIRLVLAFTIVMFGYAIMLAAMSFVILYFFAICLGLSFGEIFFNRLSIILNINKSFGACSGLH